MGHNSEQYSCILKLNHSCYREKHLGHRVRPMKVHVPVFRLVFGLKFLIISRFVTVEGLKTTCTAIWDERSEL
jgi:hypothetical protein